LSAGLSAEAHLRAMAEARRAKAEATSGFTSYAASHVATLMLHAEVLGETLKEFCFRAPTLFDASAEASAEDELILHDALGAAEHLAKIKKFAFWLKSKMVDKGLAAIGPYLDEGGWYIDVPSNGGPFVLCTISGSPGDDSLFQLLVVEIGGAPEDVGHAIEHILRNASQITELRVD
jgi:hypothetical protein